MLTLESVSAGYGAVQVLRGFSLSLRDGEVLCLLGRNGAGKTTALKAIMGLVPLTAGRVLLGEETISHLPPHQVPKRGIGYVPQGRRLFAELTVEENLDMGLMARGSPPSAKEHALTLFPLLRERLKQRSGTLSGGEQQMLAMARALCVEPRVMLLDEPTEGLMPSMILRIQEAVLELKSHGVSSLIVEQRVDAALAVADRASFVDNGQTRAVVAAEELQRDRRLIEAHVGVG